MEPAAGPLRPVAGRWFAEGHARQEGNTAFATAWTKGASTGPEAMLWASGAKRSPEESRQRLPQEPQLLMGVAPVPSLTGWPEDAGAARQQRINAGRAAAGAGTLQVHAMADEMLAASTRSLTTQTAPTAAQQQLPQPVYRKADALPEEQLAGSVRDVRPSTTQHAASVYVAPHLRLQPGPARSPIVPAARGFTAYIPARPGQVRSPGHGVTLCNVSPTGKSPSHANQPLMQRAPAAPDEELAARTRIATALTTPTPGHQRHPVCIKLDNQAASPAEELAAPLREARGATVAHMPTFAVPPGLEPVPRLPPSQAPHSHLPTAPPQLPAVVCRPVSLIGLYHPVPNKPASWFARFSFMIEARSQSDMGVVAQNVRFELWSVDPLNNVFLTSINTDGEMPDGVPHLNNSVFYKQLHMGERRSTLCTFNIPLMPPAGCMAMPGQVIQQPLANAVLVYLDTATGVVVQYDIPVSINRLV